MWTLASGEARAPLGVRDPLQRPLVLLARLRRACRACRPRYPGRAGRAVGIAPAAAPGRPAASPWRHLRGESQLGARVAERERPPARRGIAAPRDGGFGTDSQGAVGAGWRQLSPDLRRPSRYEWPGMAARRDRSGARPDSLRSRRVAAPDQGRLLGARAARG